MSEQIISLEEAIRRDGRDGDSWNAPDMSVLNAGIREAPALPLECFGPWAEWIERHAESKSVPVAYVGTALLTCATSLIGNARWAQPWPGWREPTALWSALIGYPSSGKSPAMDCSTGLLQVLEAELAGTFPDTLCEYERDKVAAKAARERWESDVKSASGNTPPPDMPADAMEPEPPVRPRL